MPRKSRHSDEREVHPHSVAATDLALSVLCAFSFDRTELGVSELAELLHEYRSRVHRAVSTLVHRGFLVRNPATEKYRLGMKLFELGNVVLSQVDLLREAAEPLEELSRSTEATTWLVQRDGDEVIDLLKFEPSMPLLVRRRVGSRTPLTFGVVGQVYLAHLSEQETNRLLAAYPEVGHGQRVEPGNADLKRTLADVRMRGYAYSVDGAYPGVTGVAAPVLDHVGQTVAVIALSAPTSQIAADALEEFCLKAVRTAEIISRRLGFIGTASTQPTERAAGGDQRCQPSGGSDILDLSVRT